MSTDKQQAHLLQLMTWLSPSFPVGAYAYSHGLEYAVECGAIHDRESLANWLEGILRFGGAASDAQLLRATWQAITEQDADSLIWAVETARAFRGSAELALESEAQGAAFAATVAKVWPQEFPSQQFTAASLDATSQSYCVAVGAVCAGAGIPCEAALTAYLHGFVANAVSAAVRLIPLGQTDGQTALADLQDAVMGAVNRTLGAEPRDISNSALMVDWSSMQHEIQYTRLFRS